MRQCHSDSSILQTHEYHSRCRKHDIDRQVPENYRPETAASDTRRRRHDPDLSHQRRLRSSSDFNGHLTSISQRGDTVGHGGLLLTFTILPLFAHGPNNLRDKLNCKYIQIHSSDISAIQRMKTNTSVPMTSWPYGLTVKKRELMVINCCERERIFLQ